MSTEQMYEKLEIRKGTVLLDGNNCLVVAEAEPVGNFFHGTYVLFFHGKVCSVNIDGTFRVNDKGRDWKVLAQTEPAAAAERTFQCGTGEMGTLHWSKEPPPVVAEIDGIGKIAVDPTMPPDRIEIRSNAGEILGSIDNIGPDEPKSKDDDYPF